jgi:hypothetical protein
MNRIASPRAIAALGLGLAMAMSAGIPAGSAQPGPRPLPNLQNQDRGVDRQPDRAFDRRDDRQNGGQSDRRDGRGFGEDRLERRLTYLHTQLRIAPAQERAWMTFADAVREQASDRLRDRRVDERDQFRGPPNDARRGPPSVVERLEERQRMLADRSADLDRVVRALRPLYASFTDEQRRAADRELFQPADGALAGRGGRGFGDFRGGPGFDRGRADPRDNPTDRDYRGYR